MSVLPGRTPVDIEANRRTARYSLGENLARVLWVLAGPFFRFSPRPCFGWRALLLRLFGARVGRAVHVYPSTRVVMPWKLSVGDWAALGEDVLVYNLGPVEIGSRATVSLGARLCAGTHDYSLPDMPLVKEPIRIGEQAWVCAEAFVGPGVTVGEGAVVGARAVVTRTVEPWTVVAGNPARAIGHRTLVVAPADGDAPVKHA
jgi:putative colanic acid biosynthesis acetyltransferase WcaF